MIHANKIPDRPHPVLGIALLKLGNGIAISPGAPLHNKKSQSFENKEVRRILIANRAWHQICTLCIVRVFEAGLIFRSMCFHGEAGRREKADVFHPKLRCHPDRLKS